MPKLTAGRTIVALLVALGAALAGANVWHRYATTNRIHDRWGTETMELVAHAPAAEWLQLAAPQHAENTDAAPNDVSEPDDGDPFTVDGKTYRVVARGDLTSARGFSNLRHALGQNGSYRWSCDAGPPEAWRWAFVFADGERRAVLLADEAADWLARLDARRRTALEAVETTDKMAAGLKAFLAEQTAPP